MKRALLVICATAYLALIGMQAAHYHKDALETKADSCAVCVLAHQSVQQAPNAAPSLFESTNFRAVVPLPNSVPSESFLTEASARAPPATV